MLIGYKNKMKYYIKLVFSSVKIGSLFGVKDPIPCGLCAGVVYKFLCVGCNACYVGEITRHFSTRVCEHMLSDRTSHILDHASTTFQLKIKEAIHIHWEKPTLNHQLYQFKTFFVIFYIVMFHFVLIAN